MKIFLVGLAVGIIAGGLVSTGLIIMSTQESSQAQVAEQTIDELINEWTIERQKPFLFLSGQVYRAELLDVRPGFFPDTVRTLAQHVHDRYKIPKGVVLAQWALESRWGLSAFGASNYFGHTFSAVKSYMPDPKFILLREKVMKDGRITAGSIVRFARYRNIAECFDVHGLYLSRSSLYKRAFEQTSPEDFARELAKRYATDPDYALKLIVIMKRYQL